MDDSNVILTRPDAERLALLADALAVQSRRILTRLHALEDLLASARLVAEADMPATVVTLGSRVVVQDLDTGRSREIAVVFPEEADGTLGKLSVLSPVGCAVVGRAVGDRVTVEAHAGHLQLRIAAIRQPETAQC